ncbi:integrase family protein [Desulfurivibrio alkaliphilus AHT 2]|uniref:Integrase family protein n=2 Tax=Desulfurivibrio alkaliphilus TaxID=427923 RepID=D6Z657_DESAT|nr:integrase family protein [Desulfurivibrio alkaliphilus AHT 2]
MKFSEAKIRNLRPQSKKYYLREANGFSVRIMPSGAKTWLFIYTFDGKRKEMNLGHYPAVTLEAARRKYRAAFDLFEQGNDPVAMHLEKKEERRRTPFLSDLVDEYINKHAMRFKRSWAKDQAILNRDVVPAWGQRKAVDISKRDVILLLEKIVDRGSPGMANNCFQIIRKMFNFAVDREILEISPCTGVKMPAPKMARDRVLSEEEIRVLWSGLERAKISHEVQRAIKLILVTAQRPGEVMGMDFSEIEGRWWTIPADRAKNGKAHRVYLTDTALELIGENTGGFVFPSPRHRENPRPIGSNAMTVAHRRNKDKIPLEDFTPHDLRRTAATFMAEMGTMDEVIDAILNHSKMGVIRVYNQYRYDTEKQATLEAWERRLQRILGAEKKEQGDIIRLRAPMRLKDISAGGE